jgi:hypothetical protein
MAPLAADGNPNTDCAALYPQAQGTGEQDEQYEDWYKHRMSIFHTVTRELVGYRTQTHVVVVKVDHHPSKTPPFQVGLGLADSCVIASQ